MTFFSYNYLIIEIQIQTIQKSLEKPAGSFINMAVIKKYSPNLLVNVIIFLSRFA